MSDLALIAILAATLFGLFVCIIWYKELQFKEKRYNNVKVWRTILDQSIAEALSGNLSPATRFSKRQLAWVWPGGIGIAYFVPIVNTFHSLI